MSRIACAFDHGPAFIGFLTGGDPDPATSERLFQALIDGGADLIEIGVPFSDPVAEGPVIQAANSRALAAGMTIGKIFDLVGSIRLRSEIPIVLLTYLNPVFVYGYERFCRCCSAAGVDGIIIPDLPLEERDELAGIARQAGIDLIALVAPSSEVRIRRIVAGAAGFVYVVSSLGVTGVRQSFETDLEQILRVIREETDLPAAIGFGISTPEQAEQLGRLCDGIIVGSALVERVGRFGTSAAEPLERFVRSLKTAISRR